MERHWKVAASVEHSGDSALPDLPSLVAVIVADPAEIADTTPARFTAAIVGADDEQFTVRPVSTASVDERNSAVAVAVPPTVICAGDIVTLTVATPEFACGGVGSVVPSPPAPPHAVITTIIITAYATRCIRPSVDCHHGTVIGRGDKVGEGSDSSAIAAAFRVVIWRVSS